MKKLLCILMILSQILPAEEMTIRSYLAKVADFESVRSVGLDDRFEERAKVVWPGKEIATAPFQSRFLTKGGALSDYTPWAKGIGLFRDERSRAVYDVKSERLVVRTNEENHALLYNLLGKHQVAQFQTEFRVFRLPGVTLGRADLSVAKVEKNGELLACLSSVSLPGVPAASRTPSGSLKCEFEIQGWIDSPIFECRLNLESALAGVEFRLNTSLVGASELPVQIELGSPDGKSTLVLSMTVRWVMVDGKSLEHWVMAENGQRVVQEQNLDHLLNQHRIWTDLPKGRRFQIFEVPPTFWTFITGGNGPGNRTIREIFAENGVEFAKEDRFFWIEGSGRFAVEASELTTELIYGIVMPAGITDPPRLLGGSYTLVESKEKLTVEGLKKGDFKILRKISSTSLPGQNFRLKTGKPGFHLESEAQISANDDYVETRLTLKQGQKEILKAGVEADSGAPLILKQEKVGAHWRTWVGTFTSRSIEKTIEEGR